MLCLLQRRIAELLVLWQGKAPYHSRCIIILGKSCLDGLHVQERYLKAGKFSSCA